MPMYDCRTVQVHVAYELRKGYYQHLILRRSSNIKPYPGIWQTITGTIESGETAVQTAIRELREETSIQSSEIYILPHIAMFYDTYNDTINSSPVFAFIFGNAPEITLSSEHSDYKWIDRIQAKDMLILPSHIEGIRIFEDFVLNREDKSTYKYRW